MKLKIWTNITTSKSMNKDISVTILNVKEYITIYGDRLFVESSDKIEKEKIFA